MDGKGHVNASPKNMQALKICTALDVALLKLVRIPGRPNPLVLPVRVGVEDPPLLVAPQYMLREVLRLIQKPLAKCPPLLVVVLLQFLDMRDLVRVPLQSLVQDVVNRRFGVL